MSLQVNVEVCISPFTCLLLTRNPESTCDASEAKQFLGILYILPMTYQLGTYHFDKFSHRPLTYSSIDSLDSAQTFQILPTAKHPTGFCYISGWHDLHAMHCP